MEIMHELDNGHYLGLEGKGGRIGFHNPTCWRLVGGEQKTTCLHKS